MSHEQTQPDATFASSSKAMEKITLYSVMRKSAPTLSSKETVKTAQDYLKSRKGHYLVLTEMEAVVGVVCACDLEKAHPEDKVETCIQGPLVLISSGDSLEVAAERMRKEGVGCLPVMFRDKMLGFVTRTHLKNVGLLHDSLSHIPVCSSCQSDRHVRLKDGCIVMAFCRDCMDHMDEYIPHAECGGEG